ncbi:MAG: hypothetical protein K1562_15345 [Candidatus Thiodiazotropha sp. (ex. Lucinisca nassula)]|nr:hypothetical protein [Candidatus Thiodiazotropha sp. (ex. Lucinisca nassula)]
MGSRVQVFSIAGSPSDGFGVHGTVAERDSCTPKLLDVGEMVFTLPILDKTEYAAARAAGVEKVFAEVDTDRNGTINTEEYAAVLEADCDEYQLETGPELRHNQSRKPGHVPDFFVCSSTRTLWR